RPAGLHQQRTQQLKELLTRVEDANREQRIGPFARRPRDLTLDFLHKLDDDAAEAFLTSCRASDRKAHAVSLHTRSSGRLSPSTRTCTASSSACVSSSRTGVRKTTTRSRRSCLRRCASACTL